MYLLVMVKRGGSEEVVLRSGHPLPAARAGQAGVGVFSGRDSSAMLFRLAERNHAKQKFQNVKRFNIKWAISRLFSSQKLITIF